MNQPISLKKGVKSFTITPHISSPKTSDLLLLGDTFRSIHPVAGQGWNLGVKDISTLLSLLNSHSINDPNLNNLYYYKHIKLHQIQLMHELNY